MAQRQIQAGEEEATRGGSVISNDMDANSIPEGLGGETVANHQRNVLMQNADDVATTCEDNIICSSRVYGPSFVAVGYMGQE